MVGVEYILLHVQDPILYVIRKQHRHSPTETTPIADYYIIAGTIYQAPDLASVFNSRLLSAVHNLQSAFEETASYNKYHPSKGYSWDFSSNKALTEKGKAQTKKESTTKEEPSSLFQRQRVDLLLVELLRKFPIPTPAQIKDGKDNAENATIKTEPNDDTNTNQAHENSPPIKIENIRNEMKPPPEKKMKM